MCRNTLHFLLQEAVYLHTLSRIRAIQYCMGIKDTFESFCGHRRRQGLSARTLEEDRAVIGRFVEFLEGKELNETNINKYIDYLTSYSYTTLKGVKSGYSSYTIHHFVSCIHVFLQYAAPELAKFAVYRYTRTTKNAEEMLDQEEIEKLIDAAQTNRDRALIAFLYESGARRGEMLSVKLENIKFDENGAVVTLPKGKTGPRRIRIVYSVTYLKQWIDTHPLKGQKSAYLFCSLHEPHGPLSWTGLRYQLKTLTERAGIDKRTYPHLLRHSRATHLASRLTEQQLKVYLGWTPGSNMAANYVHLSGRDIDPAILALNGITEPQKSKPDALQTILCPRCHERQPLNGEFCYKCSYPLSKQAEEDETTTEMLIAKLMEKPEFVETFTKYMLGKKS